MCGHSIHYAERKTGSFPKKNSIERVNWLVMHRNRNEIESTDSCSVFFL